MKNSTPNAFDAFYKVESSPANAVRLAIADHKGLAGRLESQEFTDALKKAANICDLYPDLVFQLENLMRKTQEARRYIVLNETEGFKAYKETAKTILEARALLERAKSV